MFWRHGSFPCRVGNPVNLRRPMPRGKPEDVDLAAIKTDLELAVQRADWPKMDRQPASVRAAPHPRGRSSAGHMLTLPVGVDGGATGPHVVRMRRSIRIANPLVPAAERSRGPAFAITEFATDSPLEGTGFELLVRGRDEAGLSR